jgi:hypothetical protein
MMLEKESGKLARRQGMAHDVFISYSTKDKTIADAVCAKLEENKIRVWIAPRDVPAGANFAESIIRAINTCQVFVLIWSTNTNTSNHILNEINQAFDQGITIIPFRIQDVQPSDEMRYYFGRTHWLDAINPPLENHIDTLRDTILVNLDRELQSAAPAPLVEQSPGDEVKLTDEHRAEKEPVSENLDAAKPLSRSQEQKKGQDIQPKRAAQGKLKKYIPFAAGGLVVFTLVILLISGAFKGSPPAGIAQDSPSSTAIISPTKTIRPTATATPIPAWVNEISEPILAAIKDSPPDFEDDFSQVETAWIYSAEGFGEEPGCDIPDNIKQNITDGSMKLSIDSCKSAHLSYPDMVYANYVLQLDVNFQQPPPGIDFRNNGPDIQQIFYIQTTTGNWAFSVMDQDDFIEGIEGNVRLDFSKPVTITIINKSPTFLVYLDSTPVTFYNTQEVYAGPFGLDFVISFSDYIPHEPFSLELDNIKIWDLDQIE